MPSPLYTAENVHFAYALRWSLAIFWKQPAPEANAWLPGLRDITESDGVRILEHRYSQERASQFLISTKPHLSPAASIRSVKGRLQYLLRGTMPRAFRRNYSIRSVGDTNQAVIEDYVSKQLDHHKLADPRATASLAQHQFRDSNIDLVQARRSGHGEFTYNLHLVAVHNQRYAEIREDWLSRTSEMIRGVARKRGHLLSRVGLLADHIHWTVGCNVEESPQEIGLSYLNNLAFAHGMRPVFQAGFYVGTFGPYDMKSVRRNL
jgi:REP element-mobilizing transposase RayT